MNFLKVLNKVKIILILVFLSLSLYSQSGFKHYKECYQAYSCDSDTCLKYFRIFLKNDSVIFQGEAVTHYSYTTEVDTVTGKIIFLDTHVRVSGGQIYRFSLKKDSNKIFVSNSDGTFTSLLYNFDSGSSNYGFHLLCSPFPLISRTVKYTGNDTILYIGSVRSECGIFEAINFFVPDRPKWKEQIYVDKDRLIEVKIISYERGRKVQEIKLEKCD